MTEPDVLHPPALRPGDRVAVVAPSMPVFTDPFARGIAALGDLGFVVELGANVHAVHGHLAGTDEQRLTDLNAALGDPGIRAVWVGRGGYGLTRILDHIDWDALAADPKLLIGFSDVTALHHAAWRRLRLVTVHGPSAGRMHVVAAHPDARDHLVDLITGAEPPAVLPSLGATPEPVASGRAEGRLVGGNLSLVTAGIGTPDQLETDGTILLLEEVNEAPYKIDRMLTQLRAAGLLDAVAGIVVGALVGCDAPRARASATADEVVRERLGALGVPVLAGLPLGHVDRQLAVPHGARVALDADAGTLMLLERPFR